MRFGNWTISSWIGLLPLPAGNSNDAAERRLLRRRFDRRPISVRVSLTRSHQSQRIHCLNVSNYRNPKAR